MYLESRFEILGVLGLFALSCPYLFATVSLLSICFVSPNFTNLFFLASFSFTP